MTHVNTVHKTVDGSYRRYLNGSIGKRQLLSKLAHETQRSYATEEEAARTLGLGRQLTELKARTI